jgi:choloylglycine hydrolase
MAPTDLAQYLLTTCANLDEVKAALREVRVVPVVEPALGFPAPVHFIVVEPSGKQIVIEFLKGVTTVFEAPLGVLTNAPTYDWHITNLRNHVNLSPVALPGKKIEDLEFKPLGAGSGMIGLPGDFTPPSRFVRAVAFTATARKTKDGPETVYEMFRILDNFNVPLGAAEGSEHEQDTGGMRSSIIWTVVSDTKNEVLYYHTQHNRRVRKVDVRQIDFTTLRKIVHLPLDKIKREDIEDVTPANK